MNIHCSSTFQKYTKNMLYCRQQSKEVDRCESCGTNVKNWCTGTRLKISLTVNGKLYNGNTPADTWAPVHSHPFRFYVSKSSYTALSPNKIQYLFGKNINAGKSVRWSLNCRKKTRGRGWVGVIRWLGAPSAYELSKEPYLAAVWITYFKWQ